MVKPLFTSILLIFFLKITFATDLKEGSWHITLQLENETFLPFQMELKDNKLTIINADERINIEDIILKDDSLIFSFPIFNSVVKAKIESNNSISGKWYNLAKGPDYSLNLIGKHEFTNRFINLSNSSKNERLKEHYEVYFSPSTDDEFVSIGKFNQNKNGEISGTFLTETGDFRFLEGNVYGNQFYLSAFDGSHAFLFEGTIEGDKLEGIFYSGNHYKTNFIGTYNPDFSLRNPDQLTTFKEGESKITFSLPNLDQQVLSFPEDFEKDKITIIQIMGTWCPNCKDETAFFKELQNEYGEAIQIISIGFETSKTMEGKIEAIERLKNHFNTDFTYLVGGSANKTECSNVFSMLTQIISFPTSIFIDKKGEVKLIHTGFNGPGTGAYYTNYKKKIYTLIEKMNN